MPKSGGQEGEIPLPPGWDFGRDYDNKLYFIDHNTQKTTWVDPRDSLTKPASFADCVGDELPVGWEQVLDISRGVYYVNHVEKKVQIEDPRLQWRALQEDMLRSYLVTAQEDLTSKKELVNIKQARLSLAQDEFTHLNTTLSALSNSTTSLNSTTSSTSTKYDPDLLKSDVHHARARVQRLKRELANINSDVDFKQRGVETLQHVNTKFLDNGRGLTIEEAKAIRAELLSIQQSLSTGEQEKIELMKSLACLKDDLTRLQPSESSLDVSVINAHEKFSTASQTDLSGEMVPVGARLAELARLRLQYDESRKHVQEIQQQLAALEERISPGQLESDKDRLLLIQEKEQLLRELRSINLRNRSNSEMNDIRKEIRKLECDLNNAMEVSNKCIADRLKIHEDKQFLLQQLKDSMREVSTLESQLKLLSASTLSMSSSSSLGSLSSSHASSKGSLSSLSFTDIYGMSTIAQPDSSMLDLHRRVEKILEGTQQNVDNVNQNTEECFVQPGDVVNLSLPKTSSQLSLSPRSSLSSVSPPISPYNAAAAPPTYDQAYLTSVERQKRLQASLPVLTQQSNPNMHLNSVLANLEEQFSGLNVSRAPAVVTNPSGPPMQQTRPRIARPGVGQFDLGDLNYSLTPAQAMYGRRSGQDSVGSDQSNQSAPLSPISETTTDDRKTVSSNTRSGVSAAVSDESVAGDSGVFEASNKKDDLGISNNLETTQVQIKLRYSSTDELLHVGIERARNLSALFISEGRKVCIKAALLPAIANVMCTFCTRAITDLSKPTFGENFPIAISKNKLVAKTLQVNIWAIDPSTSREECLGSSQVSMADFKTSSTSVKWYNVLSFHFMQTEVKKVSPSPKPVGHSVNNHMKQESEISTMTNSRQGTLKEESSDESTIISSQTSTLTRNMGPESMMGHCDSPDTGCMAHPEFGIDGITVQVEDDEEEDEPDEDSEDFMINENTDSLIFPGKQVPNVDAETNTECVFIQQPVIGRKSSHGDIVSRLGAASSVKRSKTFGPSAPIAKSQYNCRLNRSDSDSAMPLYRRMPFQRSSKERRSLHVPSTSSQHSKSSKNSNDILTKTSIDLELDLAAQQSKLLVLSEEIERLRQIKKQMEEAKEKGEKELPVWLQEDDQFQYLLASLEEKSAQKSSEERRMEKLLKKTYKEIYKLRKSKSLKGQLDVQSFKEKMAFFTSVKSSVPIYQEESDDDTCSESSTLQSSTDPPRMLASSNYSTPTPTVVDDQEDRHTLKEGLSTETVDTITEEETEGATNHSSQNSTPTPNLQTERFSYDVDPELGAFV